MSIIQIVVILVVIGVLLLTANRYIKMDARIKGIMNTVVIVAVVLWLCWIALRAAGVDTGATL